MTDYKRMYLILFNAITDSLKVRCVCTSAF